MRTVILMMANPSINIIVATSSIELTSNPVKANSAGRLSEVPSNIPDADTFRYIDSEKVDPSGAVETKVRVCHPASRLLGMLVVPLADPDVIIPLERTWGVERITNS